MFSPSLLDTTHKRNPLILLIHVLLVDTDTALTPDNRLLEIRKTGPSATTRSDFLLDFVVFDRRHEVSGPIRSVHLGIQLVDLLKGKTFGLVDEEVDKGHADAAEAAPDEEDFGAEIAVGGSVSGKIQQWYMG